MSGAVVGACAAAGVVDMATNLRLSMLGGFSVDRDGGQVAFETNHARAMLSYLAVEGPQMRDHLIALLWPDASSGSGRARLRRHLYALRSALGPGVIAAEGDRISLSPEADLHTDVRDFESALRGRLAHGHAANEVCPSCSPLLEQARAVYRGSFLAGFGGRIDSTAFDDWLSITDMRLTVQHGDALYLTSLSEGARGNYAVAIESTYRLLQEIDAPEAVHRQLMRLLWWSGRRGAAIDHFQAYARELRRDGAAPPEPETLELFEAISSGHDDASFASSGRGFAEGGTAEGAEPAAGYGAPFVASDSPTVLLAVTSDATDEQTDTRELLDTCVRHSAVPMPDAPGSTPLFSFGPNLFAPELALMCALAVDRQFPEGSFGARVGFAASRAAIVAALHIRGGADPDVLVTRDVFAATEQGFLYRRSAAGDARVPFQLLGRKRQIRRPVQWRGIPATEVTNG